MKGFFVSVVSWGMERGQKNELRGKEGGVRDWSKQPALGGTPRHEMDYTQNQHRGMGRKQRK